MTAPAENGIWIVEDHAPLRETLAEALGATRLFGSCEAALQELESAGEKGGGPDVMILDLGLPGMSGIEGLRRFKEGLPELQIIVFTVFDDRQRIFDAICAGASGYLLKSESLDRIAAAVGEVRRGGSPMTPEIARQVLDRFTALEPAKSDINLSDRELEVIRLLADGLAKKEVAARLDLSVHTVDNHIRRIYRKLHVNTMSGAVAKALREGLV